jgi:hypothetical protein
MHIVKRFAALAVLAGATISCGDMARQGQSPVYLVLESLVTVASGSGSSGGSTAGNELLSDVLSKGSIFNDYAAATFSLALKDITSPTKPTSNNGVTLTRYRVTYRRADGRNTPGVDVPYAFDGAATVYVPPTGNVPLTFEIVRHVAKAESPLVQLGSNPTVITTIADITFYGADQVGNDISVTGSMQIDFGNFADGN